jgi:hypothetical protein
MKSEILESLIQSWLRAKEGKRTVASRTDRYGDQSNSPTPQQVADWKKKQEELTKNHQYHAGAHFMGLVSGVPRIRDYLYRMKKRFKTGISEYAWKHPASKTMIKVGNVNRSTGPDIAIHKGGSPNPTSVIEVASGANKMWGSMHHMPRTQLDLTQDSFFDRLHKTGALTQAHVDQLQDAVNGAKGPRVAHSFDVDADGRHRFFRHVESHLRSKGISHIMVGGRIFSTDHSTHGVTNLSHIVGKTHITTSAGRGGKRFALRISGLRDPATGKKIEGNEDNYNKVIANRGFGEDSSTLV